MDKWEKIVLFHRLLTHSKYCVPKRKILDELECSEATFHRIRAFMQERLGAPLSFSRQYNGYRYETTNGEPFELPGFWLTKQEAEALLLLDNTVSSIQEGYFTGLLAPLRKRFEPLLKAQNTTMKTLRERIKILSIGTRHCDQEIFRTIAAAAIRRRTVSITHQTLKYDTPVQRTISPQQLVRYRDNWYADAYCHLRQDLRTFALNRITKAEFGKEKFHTVPHTRMQSFFADSYGIFTGPADKKAVIDFTGAAAREVSEEQWHPQQHTQWINTTTCRISIPYGNSRELIMDILRWGHEAKVVAPAELLETVKNILAKMRKNYNPDFV